MKLTIGMACYDDFDGVYFTVQALRAYHNLKNTEILIVDNLGDDRIADWVKAWGHEQVRYERYTDIVGTTMPREMVFRLAKGEYVICIDSHVLILPGAFDEDRLWYDGSLIHGPMVYDDMKSYVTQMDPIWRDNMWGVWGGTVQAHELPAEPFEIPMHGLGLFGCRRDSWLGFNEDFRGFGGEEGYIHEKFRKAGQKVLCLPWLRWAHKFRTDIPYPCNLRDRIRNYILGFMEIGLDLAPIRKHFGVRIVDATWEDING